MPTDTIFQQSLRVDKKKKVRNFLLFSISPFVFGIAWLAVSSISIYKARNEMASLSTSIDSLKKLRDSLEVDYLVARGFNLSKGQYLLAQSIQADKFLKTIKGSSLDTAVDIWYYRKSLDEEKAFLSLKELGYKHVVDTSTHFRQLIDKETNSVFMGEQVPLLDVKIVIATLIRAGFKIQHVGHFANNPQQKIHRIEVLSVAPADGSPDLSTPITMYQVTGATSINALLSH